MLLNLESQCVTHARGALCGVINCEIVRFPPKILGAGRAQLLISIVLCYKDGSDGQCVVNAV